MTYVTGYTHKGNRINAIKKSLKRTGEDAWVIFLLGKSLYASELLGPKTKGPQKILVKEDFNAETILKLLYAVLRSIVS